MNNRSISGRARQLGVLIVALAASVPMLAGAVVISGSASLDYAQEVAPSNLTPSAATGTASVLADTIAGTIDVHAQIVGISLSDITFPGPPFAFGAAGPMHLHFAPPGANGGIVIFINDATFFTATVDGFEVNATGLALNGQGDNLIDGNLYFNIHSDAYRSGEIRGQVVVSTVVPVPSVALLLLVPLLLLRRRFQA